MHYEKQGEYIKALENYKKNLDIKENVFGSKHKFSREIKKDIFLLLLKIK